MPAEQLKGMGAYSLSKLTAVRMFEHLQAENPDWDVYSVHPGVIETEMAAKADLPFPRDTSMDLSIPVVLSPVVADSVISPASCPFYRLASQWRREIPEGEVCLGKLGC